MAKLALPIGKFLLKNYFGDTTGVVGGGLLDVAQSKLQSWKDQHAAAREFERLGEEVVARLAPLFEKATNSAAVNAEAVSTELGRTLDSQISADYFLSHDLDPVKLTLAFRNARGTIVGFSSAESELFERSLEATVRYLVDLAAKLPNFDVHATAASLQRLSRMGQQLDRVLETTERIERGVSALAATVDAGDERRIRYEADYRQTVARKLDYVELFGVDVRPEARNQSLSVAYISLNVQERDEDSVGEALSLPVDRVLDTLQPGAERLLLRGEAGSGKSTLFRWTALEAASLKQGNAGLVPASSPQVRSNKRLFRFDGLGAKEQRRRVISSLSAHQSWRMKIPFLLRLRDCEGGRLPNPEDFPLFVARELGTPPTDWVRTILSSGLGIILLDGVDEVPNLHRETLKREIEGIVNAYPYNYFLLSTRPSAVPNGWLASVGFREAAVDPMSDGDKRYFIARWHLAVAHELELQGRSDPEMTKIGETLTEQLQENPAVSRLASNPLLCAMICALHRERHRKLPESQTELCEAVCQMLLHRREREGGLRLDEFLPAYRGLHYPQKRSIVQDLAHYMVRNGLSTVSREQSMRSIAATVRYFPNHSDADVAELLDGLIERSGILRETQPDRIDFVHNTIKEYLAGERYANEGDSALLAEHVGDPSWQPVVLFAASTNQKDFASELVRYVLTPPHSRWPFTPGRTRAESKRAREIFALRVRAMALNLDGELVDQLKEIERALFPPRTFSDAEALAAGGEAAVEHLRYRPDLDESASASCVRALRLIGTARARRYLREYLQDARPSVVAELAQAVDPLAIPAVLEMLLRGEPAPASTRAQIRDIQALHQCKSVTKLNLSQTRASDLEPLIELQNLTSLDLSGAPVRDLSPLTKLAHLEVLDVAGTQVTDVSPISDMGVLREIRLVGTPVTDFSPLRSPPLQSVDLSRTKISEAPELSNLSGLSSLLLAQTKVKSLEGIGCMTSLRTLDLSGTRVRDIAPLAGLTSLENLYLADTAVEDVSALANLCMLKTLDLSGTRVVDVSPLHEIESLRLLYLVDTSVSGLTDLPDAVNVNTIIRREGSNILGLIGNQLDFLHVYRGRDE